MTTLAGPPLPVHWAPLSYRCCADASSMAVFSRYAPPSPPLPRCAVNTVVPSNLRYNPRILCSSALFSSAELSQDIQFQSRCRHKIAEFFTFRVHLLSAPGRSRWDGRRSSALLKEGGQRVAAVWADALSATHGRCRRTLRSTVRASRGHTSNRRHRRDFGRLQVADDAGHVWDGRGPSARHPVAGLGQSVFSTDRQVRISRLRPPPSHDFAI